MTGSLRYSVTIADRLSSMLTVEVELEAELVIFLIAFL